MEKHSKRAFLISLMLHGLVLVLFLVAAFVDAFRKPVSEHVFTLVSPPLRAIKAPVLPPSEPAPAVEIKLPAVEPILSVPAVEIPEPRPPPPPPSREPQPKAISFDQYVDEHRAPTVDPPAVPQRRRVDLVPTIEIEGIQRDLQDVVHATDRENWSESPDPAVQDALRRYLRRLKNLINRAWAKPRGLSGQSLVVKVRFSVYADGRIDDVVLLQGDGNELFESSVRAAFHRVQDAGPTPKGLTLRPTLTFRLVN